MPVVINGSTGISGTDGSAATPAVQGSDANTGVFFPAADTIAFAEGGVEAMRIDSSGNVGIGTSNPDMRLTLQSNDAALTVKDSGGTTRAYIGVAGVFGTAPTGALRIRSDQGGIVFGYQGIEQAGIDTSNNFRFNSGYGSVATAYGCRAWVNFNGTGVVAIRASGNVTAITDNGVGAYTVNFTNALVDANYSVSFGSAHTFNATNGDQGWANLRANNGGTNPQQTGSIAIWTSSKASALGAAVDNEIVDVAVFR